MIKGITLKNFKSHKNTSINFNEGFNIIIGPNGAGKSSIIEAIVLALYGSQELRKNRKEFCLNRSEENPYEIEVKINLNKELIIKRKFGKSSDIIKLNNLEIKKEELIKRFNLYDLRPFIVLQNEIKDLTNEEKASEIIENISKIKYFSEFIDYLKEIRRDERNKLTIKEEELKKDLALQEKFVGKIKIDEYLKKLEEEINSLKKELEINNEELKKELIEKEKIENKLKEVKKKIIYLERIKEELEKINEKENYYNLIIKELNTKIEIKEREKKELEKNLVNKEEFIENYHKLRKIEELVKKLEIINNKLEEKEKIEEELNNYSGELEEMKEKIRTLLSSLDSFNSFGEKIEPNLISELIINLRKKKEVLIEKKTKISEIKKEIELINYNYEELKEKLKIIEEKEEELEKIKEEIISLKSEIRDLIKKKELLKGNKCPVCLREFHSGEKEKILKGYEELIKEKKEKIKELMIKFEELSNLIKEKEEILRKIEKARRKDELIKKLNELMNDFEEKDKENKERIIEERIIKLENIINNLNDLLKDYKVVKDKIDYFESKLKELNYFLREKEKIENELKDGNYNELLNKKDEIIANYKKIVENEKKLNSIIEEMESLNNKLKRVFELVRELKENKEKLEEELKEFDIKELKEKEKVLNEDLLKKLDIIKEIEIKLRELKHQIELKEKDKEFLIELKNKIEKNKKEIEELKKRIEKIEELIKEIDNYKKSKELMFINNLSIIATEIIDFLTDGKFSKIKIKKNEKDKLEFSVIINGIEFNPFLLSGGEQTIFSLSLRLAMAEIFNLMNNNSFLILDEPTIHLDKEVIRRFILYLQQNKKFKQLIIISHDEEFESIADKLIKIEKGKDGFSKVKEII